MSMLKLLKYDIHYNKSDNGYKIKDKNKVYKIVND